MALNTEKTPIEIRESAMKKVKDRGNQQIDRGGDVSMSGSSLQDGRCTSRVGLVAGAAECSMPAGTLHSSSGALGRHPTRRWRLNAVERLAS
jgi:hypothetical protein